MKHPLWADLWADDASTAADPDRQQYLVMPSLADPRLVIPTRPRRSSVRVLRALRDRTSLKARAQTAAMEAAAFVNAGSRALPSPGLFDVVAADLGLPPSEIVVGVHLGPPRANRKPVLAVADRHGSLLAFAKYGVDVLTDELVAHEAQALQQLGAASASGQLRHCTVPTLIATGQHDGHQYALQTPVPTSAAPMSARRAQSLAVVDAQRDVAHALPAPVDAAAALEAIGRRWQERDTSDPVVRTFADVATAWVDLAGSAALTWGCWHGDWRTTNMSLTRRGCSVWDWERFDSGVPIGLDALHLFLTSRLPSVKTLSGLAPVVVEVAPKLLRPFGVTDRASVELTVAGYFLELAGRYLDDDQDRAGARLGKVGEWLLPTLTELVHTHSSTRGGTQR